MSFQYSIDQNFSVILGETTFDRNILGGTDEYLQNSTILSVIQQFQRLLCILQPSVNQKDQIFPCNSVRILSISGVKQIDFSLVINIYLKINIISCVNLLDLEPYSINYGIAYYQSCFKINKQA